MLTEKLILSFAMVSSLASTTLALPQPLSPVSLVALSSNFAKEKTLERRWPADDDDDPPKEEAPKDDPPKEEAPKEEPVNPKWSTGGGRPKTYNLLLEPRSNSLLKKES